MPACTANTRTQWSAGAIRDADLVKDARTWPNHRSDYHPLLVAARSSTPRVRILAANAPRRYVSLAGREGRGAVERLFSEGHSNFDRSSPKSALGLQGGGARGDADVASAAESAASAASAAARDARAAGLPPIPWLEPSPEYLDKIESELRAAAEQLERHGHSSASVSGGNSGSSDAAAGDGCPYIGFRARSTKFSDAQSLWDASMAFTIAEELGPSMRGEGAGSFIIHCCGQFHMHSRLGIPEHLKHYRDNTRVACVVITPLSNIMLEDGIGGGGESQLRKYVARTLDALDEGDFVIVTAS